MIIHRYYPNQLLVEQVAVLSQKDEIDSFYWRYNESGSFGISLASIWSYVNTVDDLIITKVIYKKDLI